MINNIIESIQKHQDRNAFYIKGRHYTYKDVGIKITDIKTALLPHLHTINPKHIGVIINEDFESYVSCISVLLCGYGYVPLNPLSPNERNFETIQQAEIKVILTSHKTENDIFYKDKGVNVIYTNDITKGELNLEFPSTNDLDPAYVIFTSGSTGKPKGTPLSRANLNAFLESVWLLNWKIDENDRFLQMSSMTFDMSILTFIIPLCVGACIYTVPEYEIKYMYGLQLMIEHEITFIAVVPSTLSFLKPYFGEISLSSIRYSLVCGEAFPIELAKLWQECAPSSQIINIYGPTEATVFTHSYVYKDGVNEKEYNNIMALGDLVKNIEGIILDDSGKEVSVGDKGELCISGTQLTGGYLLNPQKNAESFFEYNKDGMNKRFYRTGDIVFIDNENTYFYVGRKDTQVKIQGHRVELGDVEKNARDITKTEKTIAIALKNSMGNYYIHLFVQGNNILKAEIIEFLKGRIPYYMIPSKVTFLEIIPLNANGKVDKIALAKIAQSLENTI
ncbi:MAG: AMP-binding protein [Bacteroidales bacterium]|nr:AMP-binding protein [Bacteroidales bacterium]